jgi:hypothetical protein
MRRSPSIVPETADRDVYLVLDDFGRLGRAWREADETETDRATVIQALLQGQYNGPVRVIAFNTAEGWARDVSEEIAVACAIEGDHVPAALEGFIDQHRMPWPEQLPLPLRRAANKC